MLHICVPRRSRSPYFSPYVACAQSSKEIPYAWFRCLSVTQQMCKYFPFLNIYFMCLKQQSGISIECGNVALVWQWTLDIVNMQHGSWDHHMMSHDWYVGLNCYIMKCTNTIRQDASATSALILTFHALSLQEKATNHQVFTMKMSFIHN